MNISYDSSELIAELKQDIFEFGEDKELVAFYKIINNVKIYTNYDFITEEMPIQKNELRRGEKLEKVKAKDLLKALIKQNNILN